MERHIEIDGGLHSILAENLMIDLCQTDKRKWKEVEEIAIESLNNRIKLWDGVSEVLSVQEK